MAYKIKYDNKFYEFDNEEDYIYCAILSNLIKKDVFLSIIQKKYTEKGLLEVQDYLNQQFQYMTTSQQIEINPENTPNTYDVSEIKQINANVTANVSEQVKKFVIAISSPNSYDMKQKLLKELSKNNVTTNKDKDVRDQEISTLELTSKPISERTKELATKIKAPPIKTIIQPEVKPLSDATKTSFEELFKKSKAAKPTAEKTVAPGNSLQADDPRKALLGDMLANRGAPRKAQDDVPEMTGENPIEKSTDLNSEMDSNPENAPHNDTLGDLSNRPKLDMKGMSQSFAQQFITRESKPSLDKPVDTKNTVNKLPKDEGFAAKLGDVMANKSARQITNPAEKVDQTVQNEPVADTEVKKYKTKQEIKKIDSNDNLKQKLASRRRAHSDEEDDSKINAKPEQPEIKKLQVDEDTQNKLGALFAKPRVNPSLANKNPEETSVGSQQPESVREKPITPPGTPVFAPKGLEETQQDQSPEITGRERANQDERLVELYNLLEGFLGILGDAKTDIRTKEQVVTKIGELEYLLQQDNRAYDESQWLKKTDVYWNLIRNINGALSQIDSKGMLVGKERTDEQFTDKANRMSASIEADNDEEKADVPAEFEIPGAASEVFGSPQSEIPALSDQPAILGTITQPEESKNINAQQFDEYLEKESQDDDNISVLESKMDEPEDTASDTDEDPEIVATPVVNIPRVSTVVNTSQVMLEDEIPSSPPVQARKSSSILGGLFSSGASKHSAQVGIGDSEVSEESVTAETAATQPKVTIRVVPTVIPTEDTDTNTAESLASKKKDEISSKRRSRTPSFTLPTPPVTSAAISAKPQEFVEFLLETCPETKKADLYPGVAEAPQYFAKPVNNAHTKADVICGVNKKDTKIMQVSNGTRDSSGFGTVVECVLEDNYEIQAALILMRNYHDYMLLHPLASGQQYEIELSGFNTEKKAIAFLDAYLKIFLIKENINSPDLSSQIKFVFNDSEPGVSTKQAMKNALSKGKFTGVNTDFKKEIERALSTSLSPNEPSKRPKLFRKFFKPSST